MDNKLTNRQKQALETEQRIKTAAITLFEKHGFENVYMEDIAEAAGCSVGNIYHYFANKEELAMQMTEHVDAEYRKLMAGYEADTKTTAKEKLLDFVSKALEISGEEAVLYESFIFGIKYPERGMLKVMPQRDYFSILRKLVVDCIDEGTLSKDADPDNVVDRLVTIHRGTLINWRICQGEFDLVEMGRGIARDMLEGMK